MSICSASASPAKNPSRFAALYGCPLDPHHSVRAEIDWIEFRVSLARRSNFHTVRSVLGLTYAYVHALDKGSGGAASEFSFRLQDVSQWSAVATKLRILEETFGFLCPAKITAVEIAIDFARGSDAKTLADIVLYAYRFVQLRPSTNNYRAFAGDGASEISESTQRLREDLSSCLTTLYAGDHKHDPVAYRLYVKSRDGSEQLPPSEWRARMEVTLQGDALPFDDIAGGARFKLEKLAKYFRFVKPKSDLSNQQLVWATALLRFARVPAIPRRAGGGQRAKHRYARADSDLNAKIYEALRAKKIRLKGAPARKFRSGKPAECLSDQAASR